MKQRILVPLFLLLFVGGCQPMGFVGDKGSSHSEKNKDQTGLQMILFYDKSTGESANDHYLDALLEVVNEYPQENRNVTIHAKKDHKLAKQYNLDKQPTLIVKDNGTTKARIEGYNEKSMIAKEVKNVIEKRKAN